VRDLSVSFQNHQILKNISFTANAGEFIGLIGPNGAGKTTLLRAIMNFIASDGAMMIDDCSIQTMSHRQRAKQIAYLAQERDIIWPVSVETVVRLGRELQRSAFASLSQTDLDMISQAMAQMDVSQFAKQPATQLSGGEKARVLIARLLAQNTPLILADEPVAGLDPAHQLNLMRCFEKLAMQGKTIIASLHDLSLSAQYCTRLILLQKGEIIADGKPEDVLITENLSRVYNIKADITHKNGRLYIFPETVIQNEEA
jgi:iron complex transport system ATP-binding protein